MKNYFRFTLLVLVTSVVTAFGQGETRIGLKAGVTSANIYGPDVSQLSNNGNTSALSGMNFGVFVNSKISKNFWIKSEVLTIQKGSILQIKNSSGQAYQSKLKSQHVDIYPISPTFHWKGFQLLAGPYISMLLSSSVQDSVGNANSSIFGVSSSLQPYRQKLDAGFVIGVEYEFAPLGISLGGRYTHGYVPLFEYPGIIVTNPGAPPLPAQKIYNESFSISLGYFFGGHRKSEQKK
jgi:hypothetical protein